MSSNAFARGFEHDQAEAECRQERARGEQQESAARADARLLESYRKWLAGLKREQAREVERRQALALTAPYPGAPLADACILAVLIEREIQATQKNIDSCKARP